MKSRKSLLKKRVGVLSLVMLLCAGCCFGLCGCSMFLPQEQSGEEGEQKTGSGKNLWDIISGAQSSDKKDSTDAFLKKALYAHKAE